MTQSLHTVLSLRPRPPPNRVILSWVPSTNIPAELLAAESAQKLTESTWIAAQSHRRARWWPWTEQNQSLLRRREHGLNIVPVTSSSFKRNETRFTESSAYAQPATHWPVVNSPRMIASAEFTGTLPNSNVHRTATCTATSCRGYVQQCCIIVHND